MKKNNLYTPFFLFLVTISIVIFPTASWSKGSRLNHQNPFVSALPSGSSLSIYGDFVATGTSVLCQKNGAGGCNNNYNGYLYESDLMYKNAVSTAVIPLNSATATLTLPTGISGNDIVWAGLYWQGHIAGQDAVNYNNDTKIQNRNKIQTIWPDGTSSSITADNVWYHDFWGDGTGNDGGYRSFYQGYKNVTTLLKNHLIAGTSQPITVGNIKANSGTDWYSYVFVKAGGGEGNGFKVGFWGNWSLVIIYNYPANNIPANAKLKNIQVNHGFDLMMPISTQGFTTFNVTLPLSGFLTPNDGNVSSQMLFYASGGEKNIPRDAFYIQNANNNYTYTAVSNNLNPANNPFNGTVSNNGVALDNSISYYPGLDLDTFDVSQYMKNQQTNTSVKLEATFSNNNGDQSTPGVIAFSTQLYEPKFCYDYAYSQNKNYFTEYNDGTALPRIQGTITPTDDINVSLYIRNQENSDVSAQNLTLSITDINTSQAVYKRNSVAIVPPNQIIPVAVPDSSLTVSDSNISGIPHGTIYGKEFFYTYYSLTPQAIKDINISLNARINYDLVLTVGGNTVSLPYSYTVGSTKFPMCTGDITKYMPQWGAFNVAAKGIYNKADTYPKFNIPTQVVKRAGQYTISSLDANSTPVAYTKEINSSTVVGITLIDAGKFHSTQASCDEPSSAISERFWVPFVDTSGSKSQVDFQTALQAAIDAKSVSISNVRDYFSEARQNTAFKIQVNVKDENNTVIQYQKLASGKYQMLNFPTLVQTYGTCKQPVRMSPNNSQTTNQVSVACGNAGNTGIDFFTLGTCHECILGYKTINICSRDNFATRPESFNIKLRDINQSDKNATQPFATDRTGVSTPNNAMVHIATGYSYKFDINATNHVDNNSSNGYTAFFTTATASDRNISFNWAPYTPTNPTIACNDLTSKPQTFTLVNGTVSSEANLSNVGEYRLGMIDKAWTIVDYDPTRMTHHKSVIINGVTKDVSNYFVGSGNALDCESNNSIVQTTVTLPSISGSSLAGINGCLISTNNHNNNDANLKYRDYNITSHPYRFIVGSLPSYRITADNNFTNGWLYMNDINNSADINHSMHFRGDITAAGYDGNITSNFVTQCYARDVNLTLDHNYSSAVLPVAYQYRLIDLNATNDAISTIPPLANNFPGDANATITTINISEGNFTKTQIGATRIDLNLNFDRNVITPINPIIVYYKELNATCSNDLNCTMQANLKNDYATDGNLTMLDTNLTHYYGRVYSTDYRGSSPINNTAIRYEVYCKDCNRTVFNINGAQSPTSLSWYTNILHVNTSDGNVSQFTSATVNLSKKTTISNQNTSTLTTGLDTNHTLTNANAPYTDRIQMTPSTWLLYNPFNTGTATNDFTVEFTRAGNWAGQGRLGETVDINTSVRTNRRMEW